MLWPMFCWEPWGPAIHVDVIFWQVPPVADHVHPFTEKVVLLFLYGNLQQKNALCQKKKCFRSTSLRYWPPNYVILHLWDVQDKIEDPIHGCSTLQFTGFKTSATNIVVPDIIAYLQGSCGVHALTNRTVWQQKEDQHNSSQVCIMSCHYTKNKQLIWKYQ